MMTADPAVRGQNVGTGSPDSFCIRVNFSPLGYSYKGDVASSGIHAIVTISGDLGGRGGRAPLECFGGGSSPLEF